MGKPIIRVEGLSKQYRIGVREEGYKTIREAVMDTFVSPFYRLMGISKSKGQNADADYIWALRDLFFEVQPGEVLGIIGRNGAGKSTLLKLLSRITEPSDGRATIGGRVGSLLEVGTGFHPELTGRENIYLNGAVLGMKRAEIDHKFDEIVAFSEVEKLIDTPVKRYSSGMYVRLAFGVAAHLEPEILFVDEVLAVGDISFQKKCLGKMTTLSSSGRTVLFISHNMAAIQSLCTRCLLIDAGCLVFDGAPTEAVSLYTQKCALVAMHDLSKRADRPRDDKAYFTSAYFEDDHGAKISSVPMGAPLRICLSFRSVTPLRHPKLGLSVHTQTGQRLFRLIPTDYGVEMPDVCGEASVVCSIPSLPLVSGRYFLSLSIANGSDELQDHIEVGPPFDVLPADVFNSGRLPQGPGDIIFVPSQWSISLPDCQSAAEPLAY